MNYKNKDFLINLFPQQSTGIEIGELNLVFLTDLMYVNPAKKLYVNIRDSCNDNDIPEQKINEKYQILKKKFKNELKHGIMQIVKNHSQNALDDILDNSLDWVYINGVHSYDFVLSILKNYYRKIKEGGLIAGDNYGAIGWLNKGATKAADEFLNTREYKTELFMIKNNHFIIKKT